MVHWAKIGNRNGFQLMFSILQAALAFQDSSQAVEGPGQKVRRAFKLGALPCCCVEPRLAAVWLAKQPQGAQITWTWLTQEMGAGSASMEALTVLPRPEGGQKLPSTRPYKSQRLIHSNIS